jgi:hypothetical protein
VLLREEHRLRVFENRALRAIFGPMRDEMMAEWRKLHNEKLHDLYYSPSIIRIMGEKRNMYRLLVGKPERKGPPGRRRRRWVDIIRMDLEEVGWGDVDWVGLAQVRSKSTALVNSVLNFLVP